MYRDPPWPPPVGVTVGGDGGDALNQLTINEDRDGLDMFSSVNCMHR